MERLPPLFASLVVLLAHDERTLYLHHADALENNGHLVATTFSILMTQYAPLIYQDANIPIRLAKDFVKVCLTLLQLDRAKKANDNNKMASTLLMRLPAVERHPRQIPSSFVILHRVPFSLSRLSINQKTESGL